MMKKGIYLTGILLITLFATGCSLTEKAAEKTAEKAVESAVESATNAEVDINSGSVTITDEENGTTTQLGEGLTLPDSFPSDVPIFEDAELVSSLESNDGIFTASFTSLEAHSVIVEFYEAELVSEGWTIDTSATLNIAGKSSTYVASKDDRQLSVGIFNADQETLENNITIQVYKQ